LTYRNYSAKEVMFYLAFVYLSVYLSVCVLSTSRQNYIHCVQENSPKCFRNITKKNREILIKFDKPFPE